MRDLKEEEIDKRIREHDRKLLIIDMSIGACMVCLFTVLFSLWV